MIVSLHALPALGMLAILLFFLFLRGSACFLLRETQIVVFLSEIQALCWVNFTSHGLLEVLIAYFAITIGIEFVE